MDYVLFYSSFSVNLVWKIAFRWLCKNNQNKPLFTPVILPSDVSRGRPKISYTHTHSQITLKLCISRLCSVEVFSIYKSISDTGIKSLYDFNLNFGKKRKMGHVFDQLELVSEIMIIPGNESYNVSVLI